MAEIERTRERERGRIPETPYEIFIRSRREFLERQETGQVVVKPSDREFYITRQGRLMYHLNPEIHKNTPLQDWRVFSHDLKTQSGKHDGLTVVTPFAGTYLQFDGRRGREDITDTQPERLSDSVGAAWAEADGCQSTCQWGIAAEEFADAGF